MYTDEKDISSWKNDIQDYNRSRKDRGFTNPKVELITQKIVKAKESQFDPVLQIFNDPIKDSEDLQRSQLFLQTAKARKQQKREKYEQDFNIVNLEAIHGRLALSSTENDFKRSHSKPSVREYNIITNKELDKILYQTINLLKDEKVKEKKQDSDKRREFDIVSNRYRISHDQRFNEEEEKKRIVLEDKYKKTHKYNFVSGSCYNPEEEKEFQIKRREEQLMHGSNASFKLPPAIRFRETVIFDRSKPIPEELRQLDERQANAKKRFQLRYAIETEYHDRNAEQQDRRQERLQNGRCDIKFLDEHKKGFDLITLEKTKMSDIEKAYKIQPVMSSWDKVQSTKSSDFTNSGVLFPRLGSGDVDATATTQTKPPRERNTTNHASISSNSAAGDKGGLSTEQLKTMIISSDNGNNKFRIKTGAFNSFA